MPDRYLTIPKAFELLNSMGVAQSVQQVRAAADRKKLPFFIDPISGQRIISHHSLLSIYTQLQSRASNEVGRQ